MIKILVLDDEKGVCAQLEHFFKYRGYKVFAATNGKEALTAIRKERPQILVLDIKMPGISGLEVLKEAKKDNPNAKAVMVTAMDDEETRRQAKELGADEYLTKPFSYDALEGIIIRMVNEVIKFEETGNR